MWNKKYPICITLADGERGEESPAHVQEEDDRARRDAEISDLPVKLYLFGRTGREKEDWFQHFLSASQAERSTSREESPGKEVLLSVFPSLSLTS